MRSDRGKEEIENIKKKITAKKKKSKKHKNIKRR